MGPRGVYMETATLAKLLPTDHQDDPAIIIPGSPALTISFLELNRQIYAFRKNLAALGVGPGTAVSICLSNSLEFVVTFLALAWQRAISAPLNPTYKQDEVDFYVDDLKVAVVVVPKDACKKGAAAVHAARKHEAAIVECYVMEGAIIFDVKEKGKLVSRGNVQIEEPLEQDVALVLHTSGTTGRPKAVPLSHRNLSTSAKSICKTYALTSVDRTMLIMPLFHVHGLLASFLATLGAGAAVIIPPRLAPSFWTDFAAHQATWYTATPTMHKILLSFPLLSQAPPVRFIRSCSSPLSPQLLNSLEAKFGAPVLEAYAMTEASHQMTSNPLPPAPHLPGSVGLPQGETEVQILDSKDNLIDPGNEGEICVRGPNVMGGYKSNPSANASAFTAEGFFRTGDYGKRDQNGYLFLTGRIKEFINKGSEKISPVELENAIASHDAVAGVVVFAVDDELYGQDVGTAVCLKAGESLEPRELQKWMREKVAPHKVPKKIWFLSEIPKTATGKVQRRLVAEKMTQGAE